MLSSKKKTEIIKKFQIHKDDSGSPEVQVALLTFQIKELIKHLKKHPKDYSSRRGLLGMVNQRKRLLNYLREREPQRYEKLIKKLGFKK